MVRLDLDSLRKLGIGRVRTIGGSVVCTVMDVVNKSNASYVTCIDDDGTIRYLLAPRNLDISERYVLSRASDRFPKVRLELAGTRILSYEVVEERDMAEFLTWLAEVVDKGRVRLPPGMKLYNINRTRARVSPKGIILTITDGAQVRSVLASNSSVNVQMLTAALSQQGIDEFAISGVVVSSRETYMGTVREMIRAFVPMGIEEVRTMERGIVTVDLEVSATATGMAATESTGVDIESRIRMARELAEKMELGAPSVAEPPAEKVEQRIERQASESEASERGDATDVESFILES